MILLYFYFNLKYKLLKGIYFYEYRIEQFDLWNFMDVRMCGNISEESIWMLCENCEGKLFQFEKEKENFF